MHCTAFKSVSKQKCIQTRYKNMYVVVHTTTYKYTKKYKKAYEDVKTRLLCPELCSHRSKRQQQAKQITLRIVGYHLSFQLTATLNLCQTYLKLLVHVL